MAMMAWTEGRDRQRLVVWIDDELFGQMSSGESIVFLAANGGRAWKMQLFRALHSSPYSLLLADAQDNRVGAGFLATRDIESAAQAGPDTNGRPRWLNPGPWGVISEARRVFWVLDFLEEPTPRKENTGLIQQLVPAVVQFLAGADGGSQRQHDAAILTKLLPDGLQRRIRDMNWKGADRLLTASYNDENWDKLLASISSFMDVGTGPQ